MCGVFYAVTLFQRNRCVSGFLFRFLFLKPAYYVLARLTPTTYWFHVMLLQIFGFAFIQHFCTHMQVMHVFCMLGGTLKSGIYVFYTCLANGQFGKSLLSITAVKGYQFVMFVVLICMFAMYWDIKDDKWNMCFTLFCATLYDFLVSLLCVLSGLWWSQKLAEHFCDFLNLIFAACFVTHLQFLHLTVRVLWWCFVTLLTVVHSVWPADHICSRHKLLVVMSCGYQLQSTTICILSIFSAMNLWNCGFLYIY